MTEGIELLTNKMRSLIIAWPSARAYFHVTFL